MSKIIISNMPLPSNTKYKWSECFAKLMLEIIVPNVFKHLNIVDKPDLQNEKYNIGVEVTTAVEESNLEMERLYAELEYGLIRNEDKVKKKIGR